MFLSGFWGALAGLVVTGLAFRLMRAKLLRERVSQLEKAAVIFSESEDESFRQRALLKAGLNILGASAWLTFVLAVVVVMIFGLSRVLDLSEAQAEFFIYASVVTSFAYSWFKSRDWHFTPLPPITDAFAQSRHLASGRYPFISRLLHWLMLEPKFVREVSFEVERFLFHRQAWTGEPYRQADGPVYVCGLARSGTTILLEILYETTQFASPTYRDMPFVLAPNLWRKISGRWLQNDTQFMRAHDDGIAIDFNSPENLEEVFWRTFCARLSGPGLGYEQPSQRTMQDFSAYRDLCVLSHYTGTGTQSTLRYLSKNNNNVLRLSLLLQDSSAQVVLVVRNPLATAWSLFQQHQRFSRLQESDEFVRTYMRWLGHHEFGLGHKPFTFAISDLSGKHPSQPDYWLLYWISTYRQMMHLVTNPQVVVVCHENLCADPSHELDRLFKKLKLVASVNDFVDRLKAPQPASTELLDLFDPTLIDESICLYKRFNNSGGVSEHV